LAEVQDTPHEVELKIPDDKKLSSEKALTTTSSPLEKVIVDKSKTTEKDAAELKLKEDKFKDDKDCKNCQKQKEEKECKDCKNKIKKVEDALNTDSSSFKEKAKEIREDHKEAINSAMGNTTTNSTVFISPVAVKAAPVVPVTPVSSSSGNDARDMADHAIRQAGEALARADAAEDKLKDAAKPAVRAKMEADEAVQKAADAMRRAE
jgi:hypothetical protein